MRKIGEKRTGSPDSVASVQAANQRWWTLHTMSYDWDDVIGVEKFSNEWFQQIDERFVHGSRLFAHGERPFDQLIPFDDLRGKKVLEIGCGMGYHAELLARAGADLTAIDISETSVTATRRRFELRGLSATVEQMDAASLNFDECSFDFVWSWGVIHHSAQTASIIKKVHRVLRPGGEFRLMVYNLSGMAAYIAMVSSYLVGFWRGKTLDECLWERTDGYMARYYTKDILTDLIGVFFSHVEAQTFGQDADAVPLPRGMRKLVLGLMAPESVARLANARGAFLFVCATK